MLENATKIFLLMILSSFVYAGPICEYKINDMKYQLVYAKKQHLDKQIPLLEKNLQKFKDKCKDSDILNDIYQNIEMTRDNLKNAKSDFSQAQIEGNAYKIRQAQIHLEIANKQYIAAQQELLRMKDLLRTEK
ncbi:DUF1090 family protein [Helicobacter sp. 13S00477-4]|uniref:DUF1090 family protein n=1 Tax=Helicobacter sp. 13S00477-4 TaxID=1905759 RepID=UPI000BA5E597|nr:DUF1090 family protein [Helicobacter sp. 13S00477-4]PAF52570.1 hypothetical protein BKH44_01975 [Helicobacter sp. 13S00477-4]